MAYQFWPDAELAPLSLGFVYALDNAVGVSFEIQRPLVEITRA